MPGTNDVFDMYAKLLLDGFKPTMCFMADPEGLPSGTYFFHEGHYPQRLGDASEFDVITYSTLLRKTGYAMKNQLQSLDA